MVREVTVEDPEGTESGVYGFVHGTSHGRRNDRNNALWNGNLEGVILSCLALAKPWSKACSCNRLSLT